MHFYTNEVGGHNYSHKVTGVRPVIKLPSNICAKKEDEKWTFTK